MGPKRVNKVDKSDEDYEPKLETVKKEEELTPAIIPDVPRYVHSNPREFKGRLGYACMNTLLRKQKPSVFSARTCRLDTIPKKGLEYVKELALQNVADMKTMIQWNEDHHIKFMRLSSDMFPFASHDVAGYDIDFAKEQLADVGALANKYGHRLTMHPGQYNQLVSLNPKVVANTVRELDYHAHFLDLMGLNQDAVMIIHMGGVYGDRNSALERFEKEYLKLPERVKRRLVLENDEMGYSVEDLLPICTKLSIPLVLDWHHHHINPGSVTDLISLLPQINKTWTDKGIRPKQHYSESRTGAVSMMERRAHSDRVQALPPTTDDVDLMIEAKDKEQAVFHLYRLYGLAPVDDDVWVEAAEFETMETKGRKSNKAANKKKAKEEAERIKGELDEPEILPKKHRGAKKEEALDTVKQEVAPVAPVAPKKRRGAKKETKEDGDLIKQELDEIEALIATKAPRKKMVKKEAVAQDLETTEQPVKAAPKKRKAPQKKTVDKEETIVAPAPKKRKALVKKPKAEHGQVEVVKTEESSTLSVPEPMITPAVQNGMIVQPTLEKENENPTVQDHVDVKMEEVGDIGTQPIAQHDKVQVKSRGARGKAVPIDTPRRRGRSATTLP